MAGGGVLFDHGWHALYCVTRWAGVPVGVAATLETRRFHEQPLEDTASVDLDTAAGVSNIFLTWAADERSNTIEIDGEEGEIRVMGDAVILQSKSQRASLVLSAVPIGRVAPSRLVRRSGRRLCGRGDRRGEEQPGRGGPMRPPDRRRSAVERRGRCPGRPRGISRGPATPACVSRSDPDRRGSPHTGTRSAARSRRSRLRAGWRSRRRRTRRTHYGPARRLAVRLLLSSRSSASMSFGST